MALLTAAPASANTSKSSSYSGFVAYQASVIQQLEEGLQDAVGAKSLRIKELEMQVELLKVDKAIVESKIEAITSIILSTGVVPEAQVLLAFLR